MLLTEMYQIAMEIIIPTVRPFFDIDSLFLVAVFRKILERVDKELKSPCRSMIHEWEKNQNQTPF